MLSKSRVIPQKIKKQVLEKQEHKCANNINNIIYLKNYECILWKYQNGLFDESGYEFDHINEYSKCYDNSLNNIQALCPNCHSVKTKRFMKNKQLFNSIELHEGQAMMEIDNSANIGGSKKRKL